MALYFGSKKIAGNTTSENLKKDLKDYTVSFDDSGTTENVNDIDGLLTKFKSKLSLSSLFNLIKTGFKILNEKASTYMTKTMMSKTQENNENKVPTSSLTYTMNQEITKNKNDIEQLNTNINNMGVSSKNAIPGVLKTFKLPSGSSSNSVKSTNFYFLPNIGYEVVDPTHSTEVYFKELLKYICSKYSNEMEPDCICFFNARPNSQGFSVLQIYNVKNVNSEGLPQYSTGLFLSLGGSIYTYGTSGYVYFFKTK